MAKLFDEFSRVVPTWQAAVKYLHTQPKRKAQNLILEIQDPLTISDADREVMRMVDAALEGKGLWPLNSVAGTIFPLDLYRRYGRPAFYHEFERMMQRGKAPGWGTYARRMISRRGKKRGEIINPLDTIVERISSAGQPQGKSYVNSYELGVVVPEEDLVDAAPDLFADTPTYSPDTDSNEWYGFPCLSHVSFKRVEEDARHAVNLTAVYRSHHYCARGLGNLLGLAQLQWFVAKEADLKIGTLTCISTAAELDTRSWSDGISVATAIASKAL
ncbi:MAG TPA: hypothetical protein VK195_18480 [Burkholderiaceae bacterium]|nr:hypothetical protein [Burkholderiaceae bacterium]